MRTLKTPISREEFEHNVNLILERAEQISTASDSEKGSFLAATYSDLMELRFLPNRRIDLHTVNESLRLQGNTLNSMAALIVLKMTNNAFAIWFESTNEGNIDCL